MCRLSTCCVLMPLTWICAGNLLKVCRELLIEEIMEYAYMRSKLRLTFLGLSPGSPPWTTLPNNSRLMSLTCTTLAFEGVSRQKHIKINELWFFAVVSGPGQSGTQHSSSVRGWQRRRSRAWRRALTRWPPASSISTWCARSPLPPTVCCCLLLPPLVLRCYAAILKLNKCAHT